VRNSQLLAWKDKTQKAQLARVAASMQAHFFNNAASEEQRKGKCNEKERKTKRKFLRI
jgi:hypothetical protein